MEITSLLPPRLAGFGERMLEKTRSGRALLRNVKQVRSRPNPDRPKVLCIGYLKTGTTSFGAAMRCLGYSHYGYDVDLYNALVQKGQIERCLSVAERFDSFDDLPWSHPTLARAFSHRFPDAKYVLLERDEEEWYVSYLAHLQRYYGHRPIARTLPAGKTELIQRYRDHNQQVLVAIGDTGNLLKMNICVGDGYGKLCPFLGVPVPSVRFPMKNTAESISV